MSGCVFEEHGRSVQVTNPHVDEANSRGSRPSRRQEAHTGPYPYNVQRSFRRNFVRRKPSQPARSSRSHSSLLRSIRRRRQRRWHGPVCVRSLFCREIGVIAACRYAVFCNFRRCTVENGVESAEVRCVCHFLILRHARVCCGWILKITHIFTQSHNGVICRVQLQRWQVSSVMSSIT